MSNHEERLDRYIDALNAGKSTGSHDADAELAGLFETVQQVHTLREAHIPATLAAELAGQLRMDTEIMVPDSHPERQRRISANGAFAAGDDRSTSLRTAQDDFRETSSPPRHRARQIIQFAGAAIAFTLFGLVLVLIFQGAGDGNNLPAAASPPVGQLAFAAGYDGNGDIYLVNADGSGLTNLTNHPATDWMPTWSPDGSRIAFVSDRDGMSQIYTMSADGSNARQLTSGPDAAIFPVWAPVGEDIAMLRSSQDSAGESRTYLYVVNADGSNPRAVTEGSVPVSMLAWSPNAEEIAATTDLYGRGSQILVYQADGGGLRNLHATQTFQFLAAWSPVGDYIAIEEASQATSDPTTFSVTIVDADGQNPRPLTDNLNSQRMPAWSPDGSSMSVVGNGGPDSDGIYIVSTDDPEDVRRLEASQREDIYPMWSPDGQQLAFLRATPTDQDFTLHTIMVINADGTGLTEIAADLRASSLPVPVWRPTPSSAQRD